MEALEVPDHIPNSFSVQQEQAGQPVVWPGIITGFSAAIAMWLVWYPLHIPGLQLSPTITAPLLLVAMIAVIARGTRLIGHRVFLGGVIAALSCSLLNLLLLGNALTEKDPLTGKVSFRENAAMIAGGFFMVSLAAGLIAGLIGRQLAKSRKEAATNWPYTLAFAAVAALVPLVAIGGAVTSAGAGMAVPDWPGTYGQNMFLYPISLMEEAVNKRVFLEHTHRLFGTLVGTTFIALVVCMFTNRTAKFTRVFSVVLLLAVIVQGIMGAIRVVDISPAFGVFHGVFGQIILAGAAILAASATPTWGAKAEVHLETAQKSRRWAAFAIGTLLIQLTLAAMYRHLGSGHALMTHVGFSLIALTFTVILAFNLMKIDKESGGAPLFKRMGIFLLHGVSLQMILGILALVIRPSEIGDERVVMYDELEGAPEVRALAVLFATAHQALGASILACSILAYAWTLRVRGHETIEETTQSADA